MGHNLEIRADGTASMFYIKSEGLPWHELGEGVDGALTSEEARIKGGQDWTVSKRPLIYLKADGKPELAEGMHILVRDDTEYQLNRVSVGDSYTPWQNEEAYTFLDTLVQDKLAMYHTAGVIGKGEKVWILAKLPGELRVGNDDITEKYIATTLFHDGSGTVKIFPTGVRIVCENTFMMALYGANQQSTFSIKHTRNLHERIEEARKTLSIVNQQYMRMEEVFNIMAGHEVSQQEVDDVVATLLPLPLPDKDGRLPNPSYTLNQRELVTSLVDTCPGNDTKGVHGTAYALWNGVTDYVDHYKRVQARTLEEPDARLTSIWFGNGQDMKQQALHRISELCSINLHDALKTGI